MLSPSRKNPLLYSNLQKVMPNPSWQISLLYNILQTVVPSPSWQNPLLYNNLQTVMPSPSWQNTLLYNNLKTFMPSSSRQNTLLYNNLHTVMPSMMADPFAILSRPLCRALLLTRSKFPKNPRRVRKAVHKKLHFLFINLGPFPKTPGQNCTRKTFKSLF